MPEIKHVFSQGKMNKDLDERLVPNGQYRHALNVQISSSEGSDVGTVQNILGNTKLSSFIGVNPKCVGAIADDKNNALYWFVKTQYYDFILEYKNKTLTPVLVDVNKKVLKFTDNIITGINIIDDLLFWTDNYNEPKKININFCKQGTNVNGYTHTKLIVPEREIDLTSDIDIREEHITLIKKSPTKPLALDVASEDIVLANKEFEFNNATESRIYNPGETFILFDLNITFGSGFKVGDKIKMLSANSTGFLPEVFDAQLEIIEDLSEIDIDFLGSTYTTGPNTFRVKVLSRIDSISNALTSYNFQFGGNNEKFFENKFVRFSYRYKYQDGELSCYAPFTEIAFLPSSTGFDYSTTRAYNTAMENNLSKLTLKNFISNDILENVVEIEILYKESNSPLVYSVDKIKQTDLSSGDNYWNSNEYEITSDIIYTVLPENQLTRPFDNLPRKALAQEITGNRIVFGNYTQNYNIDYKPLINSWYAPRYQNIEFNDLAAKPSLKSLRQYQVGVTYVDDYGRETPIFSNAKSSFKIPKIEAANYNKIVTKVNTPHPLWAKGLKFYVKETANEYYNLAMDRVYKAEDGNLWLSFPSSERNKVDEETFLILKKSTDGDKLVEQESKYKIIAISNQAPEFIKTIKKKVASSVGDPASTVTNNAGAIVPLGYFFEGTNSTPQINSREFVISKTNWITPVNNQVLTPLDEIPEQISITFRKETTNTYTKAYKVASLTSDDDFYRIVLEDPIDESDSFIYPDLVDPNATSSVTDESGFDTSLEIIIHKYVVENRPEFEGKFFVKIYNDTNADKYVFTPTLSLRTYETLAASQMYYFSDTSAANMNGVTGTTNAEHGNNTTAQGADILLFSPTTNSYSVLAQPFVEVNPDTDIYPTAGDATQWVEVLDVDNDGDADAHWFIDQAHYRGQAPLVWFDSYEEEHTQFSDTRRDPHGVGAKQSIDSNGTPYFDMEYEWLPAVLDSTTKAQNDVNFKQGIYTENDQEYIELSFSTLKNELKYDMDATRDEEEFAVFFASVGTFSQFNDISEIYNDKIWDLPDNQEKFVANLVAGTLFTLEGDANDVFYKITDNPQIERRYNHTNAFDMFYSFYRARQVPYNQTFGNSIVAEAIFTFQKFINKDNRRVTYKIPIKAYSKTDGSIFTGSILTLTDFSSNQSGTTIIEQADASNPVRLTMLQQRYDSTKSLATNNPAIWETEPKESIDLDIYYEASRVYPIGDNFEDLISVGMKVTCDNPNVLPVENVFVESVVGNVIELSEFIRDNDDGVPNTPSVLSGVIFTFTNYNGSYVKLKFQTLINPLAQLSSTGLGSDLTSKFLGFSEVYPEFGLSWSNCYSFSNGVESNRIRDDFNQVFIDKGAKASAPLDDTYKEENRKNGLIYSGIYNSTSGVNNLNQFIQAERITKDLNPTYGSIQKLFARQTDLIAFCEDRVIKILSNKDAVFNADGNPQLIASNRVLGDANPFAGDYGISQNPESFAKENFRAYFTDKQRGAVLRLSMDGLTPISEYGMSDYFSDNLKLNTILLGSYDGDKNQYNLTLTDTNVSVSFDEKVKGWTSFKSFVPEQSLSMSNDYYTFKEGQLYQHHVEKDDLQNDIPRNNFYGEQYISSVEVLLNDQPSIIKTYKTLNYEGSDSRIISETSSFKSGYHNLQDKDGWFSTYIRTNKNDGYVSEFVKKEGKWFNFIKGNDVINNEDIDTKLFTYQGLGKSVNFQVDETLYTVTTPTPTTPTTTTPTGTVGCMNPAALNYDPTATIDDPSLCQFVPPAPQPPLPPIPVPGCIDPNAVNYDPLADVDDGSCVYPSLIVSDTADDDITGTPYV